MARLAGVARVNGRVLLLILSALGGAAMAAPAVVQPRPVVLWNTTASAPLGLYRLRRPIDLRVGDWVALRPPPRLASYLAERGYLPRGVPLLKRIAARAPSLVCRRGLWIEIDGVTVTWARRRDHLGRDLPSWSGCRRLARGELFLLNPRATASLDSRYFGPFASTAVVGRAAPLWTWRGR
jgi:conjugative transfer signal peptidase TraF